MPRRPIHPKTEINSLEEKVNSEEAKEIVLGSEINLGPTGSTGSNGPDDSGLVEIVDVQENLAFPEPKKEHVPLREKPRRFPSKADTRKSHRRLRFTN